MSFSKVREVVCGCGFWERVGDKLVEGSAVKTEALLLDRTKHGAGWTRERVPTLMGGVAETWRCPTCTAQYEREKARVAEAAANAAATQK